MPLSLLRTGTALVYGGVDIAAEYFDKNPAGSFKGPLDWSRAGVAVGGALVTEFTKAEGKHKAINQAAEAAHLAAVPLLEKSVADFILGMTKNPFRAVPRGQITVRRPGAGVNAPGGVPGVVY